MAKPLSDMTAEQLRELIDDWVERRLEELLGNPDKTELGGLGEGQQPPAGCRPEGGCKDPGAPTGAPAKRCAAARAHPEA